MHSALNGMTDREIVDTNVILRFLVADDKEQHEKAKRWFTEGESGKRQLFISVVVVAEACFVLESFYKKSRDEIANAFEIFLSQYWLVVEERKVLLAMWQWYRNGLHFVDSFLLAWAKEYGGHVLTFDKQVTKKR